jgi:hypothetical protein
MKAVLLLPLALVLTLAGHAQAADGVRYACKTGLDATLPALDEYVLDSADGHAQIHQSSLDAANRLWSSCRFEATDLVCEIGRLPEGQDSWMQLEVAGGSSVPATIAELHVWTAAYTRLSTDPYNSYLAYIDCTKL